MSETIGECGVAEYPDHERMEFELGIGINLLRSICDPEPQGFELSIQTVEHDLGSYKQIALLNNDEYTIDFPMNYVCRCQDALDVIDSGIDWNKIWEHYKKISEIRTGSLEA